MSALTHDRDEWRSAREADVFAPHPQDCRCRSCIYDELAPDERAEL